MISLEKKTQECAKWSAARLPDMTEPLSDEVNRSDIKERADLEPLHLDLVHRAEQEEHWCPSMWLGGGRGRPRTEYAEVSRAGVNQGSNAPLVRCRLVAHEPSYRERLGDLREGTLSFIAATPIEIMCVCAFLYGYSRRDVYIDPLRLEPRSGDKIRWLLHLLGHR